MLSLPFADVNKICLKYFCSKEYPILSLPSAFEKRPSSSQKKYHHHQHISKFYQKDLVGKIKALTFALPNKNGWSEKGQKIFESLEVTAQSRSKIHSGLQGKV